MIQTVSLNQIQFKATSNSSHLKKNNDEGVSVDKNLTGKYLENLAMINISAVKKITTSNTAIKNEYKNNLRSMIQNNESVMLAIIPKSFTAEDINGDDKISLQEGEKVGTFLSAISRLDEIKEDGINTLHILPIHPSGKIKAMGTAGSIYAPAKFLEADGHLAYDPILIDKDDSRTPDEQFKAFIDECHKRDIKVMLDIPSCASVDWFIREPELMAFGRHGEDKTPQGWADIRMFEPWADETKRELNPALYELHQKYVDACIELGIDGIRADVARAKPTEFWDRLITYSHTKDPEFAWLAESYTYECASPQVNMPYDRPEDLLRAGFDDYYGQYHIFHDFENATKFNDYVVSNLDMSYNLPSGKSVIGSFFTHDDSSLMLHGGENYCKLVTVLQSTIPMCNPYFVDGFQTGDYYDYKYNGTYNEESFVDNKIMKEHKNRLAIFNLARKPGGEFGDIEKVMKGCLKMRSENLDLFADRNSSFIKLNKREDRNDQIITFIRHNNGRTALVVANKNPNHNVTGIIEIPGLKKDQTLKNMIPEYGDKSEFQVKENELRVNLAPADAYVFEIDTPNIEKDRNGHVFKQKI